MNSRLKNLEDKLIQWALATAAQNSEAINRCTKEVYRLVFREDFVLGIYDEGILRRLGQVLDGSPPEASVFGEQVHSIHARIEKVTAMNNLFYDAIHGSIEGVIDGVCRLGTSGDSVVAKLRSSKLAEVLKNKPALPSERVQVVMEVLACTLSDASPSWLDDSSRCLEALRDREAIGRVNALLLHRTTNHGIVMPINAVVQDGTGKARTATASTDDFVHAVDRARMALVKLNFMTATEDAVLMGEVSDASYSGSSIALGAAIALYSSRSRQCLDPYTAFTGDIKLEDADWQIRGVQGIREKLLAARKLGVRKVFVPADNESDIPEDLKSYMRIISVSSVSDAILRLQLPTSDVEAESLQMSKVRALERACTERGWDLSAPTTIQDGSLFTISPPTPPAFKVAIYATGAHSPRHDDRESFRELLACLNEQDEHQIPLASVQQGFIIKDPALRAQIRDGLKRIGPAKTVAEKYCDSVLCFEIPPEKLVIKQYSSGKLQIQGKAGELYKRALEVVIPLYNVNHPKANLTVEQFLTAGSNEGSRSRAKPPPATREIEYPYIGTDESGKGDYFGPLVVAAVWLDTSHADRLETLGVRDSKTLSDKRCAALAKQIREICAGSYEEVEILPERYNSLYEELKKEKKTLNHLLAWGHARALETLLRRRESGQAVADQFGDEGYIRSKLMHKGKSLSLLQTPKAERYLAVAAASVLARDRFVSRLEKASREHGILLPKGASAAVVEAGHAIVAEHGPQFLRQVAKLHFKTTGNVLKDSST